VLVPVTPCVQLRLLRTLLYQLCEGLQSNIIIVLSAQSKDAERIRDFLVQHTPHKIFVGGSCMQCTQLYEDLDKVLEDILGNMPSAFTRSETGYIQHTWADESLAALWETSEAAMQEMSDQLPLVRRAVRHLSISHHRYCKL